MLKNFHSSMFYASDLAKTAEFYKQLSFKIESEDKVVRVKIGNGFQLSFIDENQTPIKNETGLRPKGLGVYTYVEVDNVDEYYQTIRSNGVVPRTQPRDWPWGKREFVVKDPDGYKLVFYSPIKK